MTVMSDYEQARQRRIEENQARMNVLGLASTVKETVGIFSAEDARKRKVRAPSTFSKDKPQTRERRRSKRVAGEEAPSLNMDAVEGREPERQEEVYGVEHVRALGACTKPWDLFVDGYDPKGNRIYDKSAGLTCHQCRQKTLGKRTACSLCNSLQGLFCGDCLFMRYGENIDEVKQNSSWICPPCRDLCNCSFHRSRKGWCPTGSMYRRAIAEGYASVAHYLVLNNLDGPDSKQVAKELYNIVIE